MNAQTIPSEINGQSKVRERFAVFAFAWLAMVICGALALSNFIGVHRQLKVANQQILDLQYVLTKTQEALGNTERALRQSQVDLEKERMRK